MAAPSAMSEGLLKALASFAATAARAAVTRPWASARMLSLGMFLAKPSSAALFALRKVKKSAAELTFDDPLSSVMLEPQKAVLVLVVPEPAVVLVVLVLLLQAPTPTAATHSKKTKAALRTFGMFVPPYASTGAGVIIDRKSTRLHS